MTPATFDLDCSACHRPIRTRVLASNLTLLAMTCPHCGESLTVEWGGPAKDYERAKP